MVLVLSYSKNKRDFENEINGSKTDPGQMSQDIYESVAGPRRMYVNLRVPNGPAAEVRF